MLANASRRRPNAREARTSSPFVSRQVCSARTRAAANARERRRRVREHIMILTILLDVLAPILLMIAVGALLRYQFHIDLGTLSKLNLYLLVPAFVFDKVSTSTLSWAQMGGVVTISIVQVVTLGLIVFGVGRLL